MIYRIDEGIFDRFPNFHRGVVLVKNADNTGTSDSALYTLLKQRIKEIEDDENIAEDHPTISVWQDAYEQFPKGGKGKARSSVEALVRRIKHGKGDQIPFISPLVCISNLISLTYLIPSGLVDVSKVPYHVELGFASGAEQFKPIGGDAVSSPERGEIILFDPDSLTVMCARWNSRGGQATMISPSTTNAFIDLDTMLPVVSKDRLKAAAEYASDLLREHCGAETELVFLHKHNPVIELPFEGTAMPRNQFSVVEEVSQPLLTLDTASAMSLVPEETIVVSGIQPSGELHLGNYFGAIRQHIALQTQYESYYFIVNYHALTTLHDRNALERFTLDVATTYLALGFDPEKAALFLQSDVPQVTELAWIFYTLTPVSQLEKGVAFKEKVAQGLAANAGLFNYPVLQAADILIYGGTLVPVGADQKQHIEITRDIAQRFNRTFAPEDTPLFPIPEPFILEDVAVVPGLDGRKMSKSYGNTIGIFDEGKALKKKVMSIVTDSTPLEAPKDPDTDNVFALIKLFADADKQAEIADAYRAGGYGYGHAKKELVGLMSDYFAEARERRRNLIRRPDYVLDVLRDGAKRGREKAEAYMVNVRDHLGLITSL